MAMLDPSKAVMEIMKRKKAAMPMPNKEANLTEDTDGELDPREMAAKDIMEAFKSGSHKQLLQAMGNFHDLHLRHRELEEAKSPRDEEDLSMESDRPEL